MKAVVELGGKQYLIEPGTIFLAEKIPVEKGGTYSTDKVLMILDGDEIVLGKPYVEKAKVTLSILDQTKRKKVIVQKFRARKGFLRTRGHRQPATQVQVKLIEGAGKKEKFELAKKPKKAATGKKKAKATETEKAEE
ncbi:MAG: 50S ribosomal protein L21 [bacterium]